MPILVISITEFLSENENAFAALDVFEQEPVDPSNELISHPNFHGTPHIGAATIEAQRRVGIDIANNVMNALNGKSVKSTVNSHLL